MTIGIDASRASKAKKTGTEWYSYHVLKAMTALDSASEFNLYTKDPIPFALPRHWHEHRIVWPFQGLWTQGGLSLEMIQSMPDVLFVPSHAIPIIHPRRTITTIHDIGFLEWREYRSKKDLAYLDWSTRYAVAHCSDIIAISDFTKRELVRAYHADPSRVHVIHHGLDDAYHTGPVAENVYNPILERYAIARPFLLFVGRIDSRKNIARIIQAFAILKKEKIYNGLLVLAGPLGYDGKDMLDICTHSLYADSIRYVGWVDEHEKRALMSATDVFVFPSVYEGFGLPVIEAQSCGAPVVCSETTSLPEIAGHGAVFVDPVDVNDIARGIGLMLSNSELQRQCQAEGRANAALYTWARCAQETLDVLEGSRQFSTID